MSYSTITSFQSKIVSVRGLFFRSLDGVLIWWNDGVGVVVLHVRVCESLSFRFEKVFINIFGNIFPRVLPSENFHAKIFEYPNAAAGRIFWHRSAALKKTPFCHIHKKYFVYIPTLPIYNTDMSSIRTN